MNLPTFDLKCREPHFPVKGVTFYVLTIEAQEGISMGLEKNGDINPGWIQPPTHETVAVQSMPKPQGSLSKD